MYDTYYTADQVESLLAMSSGTQVWSALVSVFQIICLWKVFQKAGKEGWEAIIPIYNAIVLFKICGIDPKVLWWLLLPVVGWIIVIVYSIKADISLAKAFGKSSGFAVGLIFLPTIFTAILAFDSSVYNGNTVGAK